MNLENMKTRNTELVRIENVTKHFKIGRKEYLRAVDGISFSIFHGETLGIVGESGCGKTTTGMLLVRLIKPTSGKIVFKDKNIADLDLNRLRPFRREMQIIFQDPYGSLNPRMRIGDTIKEPLIVHKVLTNKTELKEKVEHLLDVVGLKPEHAKRFPHEFSGGQRQRICIARALSLNPNLIVCDEPVSALDVSIQSQVINLLKDLQKDFNLTYVFISHDLSVIKHISTRVGVMYLGKILEITDVDSLFSDPRHPYTQALLSAIPVPNPLQKTNRILLAGDVPSPVNIPSGCRFHPRCRYAMEVCRNIEPQLSDPEGKHYTSCHLINAI